MRRWLDDALDWARWDGIELLLDVAVICACLCAPLAVVALLKVILS